MIPSITCLHSSIVYFMVLCFEMLTSVHGALKEVYVPDKHLVVRWTRWFVMIF